MAVSAQEAAMRKLGFSDSEIAEVMEADRRIDKGEKLFELSGEQKQTEKKMRQADRTPTAYTFTPRERKADNDKRELIRLLIENMGENVENVQIINQEREFLFTFNNKKYKIVLSCPRN